MFGRVLYFFLSCAALFTVINATGLCPDASGGATAAVCDLACQFQNNGSFMPNAFSCSNELADATCATLFPCSGSCSTINGLSTVSPVGTDAPYVRAYGCTAPATATLALQCAFQCGICCLTAAYNCTDDSRSPINCGANIGNCRNPSFQAIMTQYCPNTCGLCGGNCKDNVTGCNTLAGLCQNINWYAYMQANCASTYVAAAVVPQQLAQIPQVLAPIGLPMVSVQALSTPPLRKNSIVQEVAAYAKGLFLTIDDRPNDHPPSFLQACR
uniref:ShKT domain-containing protein n=1 Tax=Panagrolaimus sp. JU765 TaxID=591449 RepID=A0AC34Q6S1_9BILA